MQAIRSGGAGSRPAEPANGRETAGAHSRRRLVLAVVLIGIFMSVLDGIVVGIALPTITTYYGVPVAQSQWVVTAYLVTITSLFLFFGRFSDYFGKNRLFLLGMGIFTASSLGCALAPTLPILIGTRILQATGASMAFSISSAIVFTAYPRGEQGRAMGYIGATVSVASLAGPAIGGLLTEAFGWEYIFLINVPVGIALLAFGSRVLDRREERRPQLCMDWRGAFSMILATVAFILLLGEFAGGLRATPAALLLAFVSAGSILAFVRAERTCTEPLVDFGLIRNPQFILPLLSSTLFFAALLILNISGPFYFEGVMGLSPAQVGWAFMIVPAITVVASPLTGAFYDRRGSRHIAILGLSISAAALTLVAYFASAVQLIGILAAFVALAMGNALFQSPNNTEILRASPPSRMGLASSLQAMGRNLGMSLGVSFAGILLSLHLHRSGYSGAVLGADPQLLADAIGATILVAAFCCALAIVPLLIRGKVLAVPGWREREETGREPDLQAHQRMRAASATLTTTLVPHSRWREYKQQEGTGVARMTTTRDIIRTLWDAQGYSNIAVYRDGTTAPCAPGASGERDGQLPVAILKPIPLVGGIPTLDHALADPELLEGIERTLGEKGLPIGRG